MKIARMGMIPLLLNIAMAARGGEPATPAPPMPPGLADWVISVTDTVLASHIDPPTRQEMVASGIKSLHRAAGLPAPVGVARRLSALNAPGPIAGFLRESWPKTTAAPIEASKLQEALIGGLLAPVPGRAYIMSAKEAKVAESMAGNRYVGIHVAIGMDEKEKRPLMVDVFPRGPADRAGVKKGDLLESVNGVDTKGMEMRAVIDRLRGDEGTDVTIAVRQPKASKLRTYTITRGQLPRTTIEGIRNRTPDDWEYRIDGPDPIGYLKIKEIGASTAHELRKLARQLEKDGVRALVIDLRGGQSPGDDAHPAVLLADSLLESGTIGRLRTVNGETTYQADPDALFRGWPIAVLVDPTTWGASEWVAAALQDNHRAVVVGMPTRGAHRRDPSRGGRLPLMLAVEEDVHSNVPIAEGLWWISLATGYLERGDGRPMADRDATWPDEAPGRRPPKGGVQPDRKIAPAREQARSEAKPAPPQGSGERAYAPKDDDEPPPKAEIDPVLQGAVKILHEELAKR